MIFTWWRRRRRRKILSQPFPAEWEPHLARHVPAADLLTEDERERLRRKTQIFVAEKYWEGCNGLTITDEIRVTIAAQACLLVLGFEEEIFNRLLTVLVYPEDYFADEISHQPGGVVVEGKSWRLGEAWHGGPVILSWPRVLEGGHDPHDGENVVLHEFAHVLDMQDHGVDGTPPLESPEQYRTWKQVMTAEYQRLVRHADRGRHTLLDQYGTKNEAEFFAVSTEAFFEQPVELQMRHPELYGVLCSFYRQDPAARLSQDA